MEELESLSVTAAGVREDVENIINTFAKEGDGSFIKFAEIWKRLRFPLIFYGFKTYIKLMEFSEVLINTVKRYVFKKVGGNSHLDNLGAMYLLYSVYHKQPIRTFAKIRVTQAEVLRLRELLGFYKSKEYYEALYCLYHLVFSGAFHCVATVVEMIPELKQRLAGSKNPLEMSSDVPTLESITESESFKDLAKLCQEFVTDSSKIENLFDPMEKKVLFSASMVPEFNIAIEDSSVITESLQTDDDIGLKRRELKAVAMESASSILDTSGVLETDEDVKHTIGLKKGNLKKGSRRKQRAASESTGATSITFETIGLTSNFGDAPEKFYRKRGSKRLNMMPISHVPNETVKMEPPSSYEQYKHT